MKLVQRAQRESTKYSSDEEIAAALAESDEFEAFRAEVRKMPDSPDVETAKSLLSWVKTSKPLWSLVFPV